MFQSESTDARAIVQALHEIRDAILFHAAYTTSPESFPNVGKQDENFISHGIKSAFKSFQQRQI